MAGEHKRNEFSKINVGSFDFYSRPVALMPLYVYVTASLLCSDAGGSWFRLVRIEGDFDLSRREMSALHFDVSEMLANESHHPSEIIPRLVGSLRSHSRHRQSRFLVEFKPEDNRPPSR